MLRDDVQFLAHFVDEVYAIADAEWVASKRTIPAGFTLAQLEAQMAAEEGLKAGAKRLLRYRSRLIVRSATATLRKLPGN